MAVNVEELLQTENLERQLHRPPAIAVVWTTAVGKSAVLASQAMAALQAAAVGSESEVELRTEFKLLVLRWKRETALLSSITKTSVHPAYQQIIGMGPKVLPLIFEELATHGGHWFWALQAITRKNPAHGCSDFEGARQAWLSWWRSRQIDEKRRRA